MAAMAPSVVQCVVSVAPSFAACNGVNVNASSSFHSSLFCNRGLGHAKGGVLVKSRSCSRQRGEGVKLRVRAVEDSSAGAAADSVVSEVALLEEEPPTPGVGASTEVAPKPQRPPGALKKGGTLDGKEALGKDPSKATLGAKIAPTEGAKFSDPRWKNGNWDLSKFSKGGKVDWDGVIDAEVRRRKWLEDNPETSSNDDPVVFETSMVPWWAWVKRFHLPEAELLNGRAAMLGYAAAYLVDSLTGAGLVDQQNSFFGKLFLWATIAGVLLIRRNEDLDTIKNLVKESTFYDKQWQATWKEDPTKEENTKV